MHAILSQDEQKSLQNNCHVTLANLNVSLSYATEKNPIGDVVGDYIRGPRKKQNRSKPPSRHSSGVTFGSVNGYVGKVVGSSKLTKGRNIDESLRHERTSKQTGRPELWDEHE